VPAKVVVAIEVRKSFGRLTQSHGFDCTDFARIEQRLRFFVLPPNSVLFAFGERPRTSKHLNLWKFTRAGGENLILLLSYYFCFFPQYDFSIPTQVQQFLKIFFGAHVNIPAHVNDVDGLIKYDSVSF